MSDTTKPEPRSTDVAVGVLIAIFGLMGWVAAVLGCYMKWGAPAALWCHAAFSLICFVLLCEARYR